MWYEIIERSLFGDKLYTHIANLLKQLHALNIW